MADNHSTDEALEKIEKSVTHLAKLEQEAHLLNPVDLKAWLGKKFIESDLVNLFENAPDGIVVIEAKGLIVSVNCRMEELFGWKRLDMLGKPVVMLIPDHLKEKHEVGRLQFFLNPQVRELGFEIETFGKHRDQHYIPISITLSYVKTHYETLGTAFIRLRKVHTEEATP